MDFFTFSAFISEQINYFQMLATVAGNIHHRFCQQSVWSLIQKEEWKKQLISRGEKKKRLRLECAESPMAHAYLIRMCKDISYPYP